MWGGAIAEVAVVLSARYRAVPASTFIVFAVREEHQACEVNNAAS
jgi:hypothetical protein